MANGFNSTLPAINSEKSSVQVGCTPVHVHILVGVGLSAWNTDFDYPEQHTITFTKSN